MKRILLAAAITLALLAPPARAHDAYDDSEANPLRIAAYAIYPAGFAIEWLVMRPFHFFVSQPSIEPISGHRPHESPFGGYDAYVPDQR